MKKWIILILIAAIWGYGAILAWTMRDAGSQVFIYYGEGEAVEEQLISHALDGEQEQTRKMLPEITAWSRAERLKVLNPGLGRSEEADCIAVYGLKEMASSPRLLGGTYGCRSDQDGCVISSGLAMELFGGLDVAGKYIWCRQKPYRIRGVTDESSHVILLPAKEKDAMRYMMFTYVRGAESGAEEGTSHGMETGKSAAENFLYRNGIKSGKVLVDGTYFSSAAGLGVCLPLWITSVWMLSGLSGSRRGIRGRTKEGIKKSIKKSTKEFILAAVFSLAGLLLAWKLELKIPPDLIPSRWSDFEFWARKIGEMRSDMADMGEAGAVWWLAQMKGRLSVCLLCSFIGAAGGVIWTAKCTGRSRE